MPLPAPSKLSVLSLFHYVNLHFIYYKKKKKKKATKHPSRTKLLPAGVTDMTKAGS